MSQAAEFQAARWGWRSKMGAGVGLLIVATFFFSPPVTVLDKSHAIGYAICHQWPERTFWAGDEPLPLCARCTGQYLGFLVGLAGAFLLRRSRTVELPPVPILATLVLFIGAMALDAANSYLAVSPILPHLYPPQNWLRLLTGTLHGLALSVIAWPVVNMTIWQAESGQRRAVIQSGSEFALYLIGAAGVMGLVWWQQPWLLYPLAILSTLGVAAMLTLLNLVLVLIITRQTARARRWVDIALPAAMAVGGTFLFISAMDGVRAAISYVVGLPL
jgi:uncharacterized membrane protein